MWHSPKAVGTAEDRPGPAPAQVGNWGGGYGGGAEAAYIGEEALDAARVAGEAHRHALALVCLNSGGPHHLALLAVHELVAVRNGVACPREEDLVADLVAARQRRWRIAAHLRR